jgi:hypothetical protein
MRTATGKALLPSLIFLVFPMVTNAQSTAGAPRFEFGGGIVGSFYDDKTLSGPGGTAKAGFQNGLGASIWLGQHNYSKVSGEIRYDYLRNDLMLDGAGTKVTFGGESHAIHYDVHFHFTDRKSRTRPYVLAGGGIKQFRGTGQERAFQPLSQIAVLTKTSQMAGLLTFGVGVKFALGERVWVRLEFRDNLTRFPQDVITPNRATGASGWINNFAPTAGLSIAF